MLSFQLDMVELWAKVVDMKYADPIAAHCMISFADSGSQKDYRLHL